MKVKVNSETEYRLLDDYEITEQAGSTAVMDLNIKLDNNEVPEPYDMIEVIGNEDDFEGNILQNGGLKENVTVTDDTLSLEKSDTVLGNFDGLTLGDITE